MEAYRLKVAIPEDRVLKLPDDVPTGPAEVIVLSEKRTQPPRGSWERIHQYLARTPPARPGKTKEEIDRYLAEERASWDGDQ